MKSWICALVSLAIACGSAFGQQLNPPAAAPDSATPAAGAPSDAATSTGADQPPNLPTEAERARLAAEKAAHSRGWIFLPSVGITETASDNAALGSGSSKHADLLSQATAGFVLFVRSARLSADGDFRLDLFNYAEGYGQNRLQPTGTVDATWTIVDRHFYVETGLTSTRVLNSPYGPNTGSSSTVNSTSETTFRLAPRFGGDIGTEYRYQLRSENGYTHSNSGLDTRVFGSSSLGAFGQRPNTYSGRQSGEFESRPQPFGWIVSADREQTRYSAPIDEMMTTDTARLMPRFRPNPELLLGARIGYQRNNFGLISRDRHRAVIGGDLSWQPSPHTDLKGFAETRPFGTAWQLDLRGRSGILGMRAHGERETTTAAQSQFQVSGLGDLQSVVNSIYLAQVPDPVQRSELVQQMLAGLGARGATVAPLIELFLPALTRIERATLTAYALTGRELASLTVYGQRNEVLLVDGAAPTTAETAFGTFRQVGGTLVLTHRLTAHQSVSFTGAVDRAQGLSVNAGDHTLQRTATLQLNQGFSNRLDGVGGLRHRSITSNLLGDVAENEIFAGLVYRP